MRKSNIHYQIFVLLGLLAMSSFKQKVLKFYKLEAHNHVTLTTETKPPVEVLCPIRRELQELKKNSGILGVPFALSDKQRALTAIIDQVSLETGAPADLLHAICEVESNSNDKAFKTNDGGISNHAFGMCQVLRRTGEMVLNKKMNGCYKDYAGTPMSKRTKAACPLFDTYTNIAAAGLYLKLQMNRYNNLEDLIASYNAGSIRRNKKSGDYINRIYINKVFSALKKQKIEHFELTVN